MKAAIGRLWFSANALWRPFEFRLSNSKDCKDLKGNFGITDIEAGVVYLQESLPFSALCFTAMHEFVHVMLVLMPGESDRNLKKIFGCGSKDVDGKEEDLAVHLAPRMIAAFVDSGLLTFPPVPTS